MTNPDARPARDKVIEIHEICCRRFERLCLEKCFTNEEKSELRSWLNWHVERLRELKGDLSFDLKEALSVLGARGAIEGPRLASMNEAALQRLAGRKG
jgi:hypothetical protein